MSREPKEGDLVIMNPFTRKDAIARGCVLFTGEKKVIHYDGYASLIEGSNWWKSENILIRGVDYT